MTKLNVVIDPKTAEEFATKWLMGNNDCNTLVPLLTEAFYKFGQLRYNEGYDKGFIAGMDHEVSSCH